MPCGCGKKRSGTIYYMGQDTKELTDPTEWGPILWKYLHCLSEKIGMSGNKIVDTDQAHYMEILLNTLYLVLPCTECQAHASAYIATNPVPSLKGIYGDELRNIVRMWLLTFHNHVRSVKGQPILITTIEDYVTQYEGCFVPNCEYSSFVQSVAAAVRQGWVKMDNWRKWYSSSEKIRILSGNVVV